MSDVARILKEARDQGRLTALDFAKEIFDDFIERFLSIDTPVEDHRQNAFIIHF